MFFLLSKGLWFVLTPSNALVGLALIGAVLGLGRARFARAGRRLACAALVLLALLGFGPSGTALLLPLEGRFPAFVDDGRPVDGIVVLGGAAMATIAVGRNQLITGEAGERLVAMADLARRYPAARVVFSGGSAALVDEEPAEADIVARFAPVLALDPRRIIVENRSRTTWENAVESRKQVDPKPGERWLLVTSAWHMPRAIGCFRQAGFPVTAYPVDYLTAGPGDLADLQPRLGGGIDRLDLVVKEWVGLLAYRLSGRTDALFPAP